MTSQSHLGGEGSTTFAGGSNQYLEFDPGDIATDAIMISCWIRGTNLSAFDGIVWNRAETGGNQVGLFLGNPATEIGIKIGGGVAYSAAGIITQSQWHHVLGVWRHDTNLVEAYVDGVMRASATPTSSSVDIDAGPWMIGNDSATSNRAWQGQIEDVLICAGPREAFNGLDAPQFHRELLQGRSRSHFNYRRLIFAPAGEAAAPAAADFPFRRYYSGMV